MPAMSSELVARMTAFAPRLGPNTGRWPGLTTYRFDQPTKPEWEDVSGLSIGIVAQGRKAVLEKGRRHIYDQSHYLIINGELRFESEILDASPTRPCLCLVLEVAPATVRDISRKMPERHGIEAAWIRGVAERCVVSSLDDEVIGSTLRFLGSLTDSVDREVLAPLYVRELIYRVLQREQFARMLLFANRQSAGNPVGAALSYINAHWAEPITVAALAAQVGLSSSAFSRAFRDVTGSSPYQYVKEVRLNRARELVIDGRLAVTDIAGRVGYSSASHFIKEFRGRFGTTPREYVGA